jgi:hypothetical protein
MMEANLLVRGLAVLEVDRGKDVLRPLALGLSTPGRGDGLVGRVKLPRNPLRSIQDRDS